MARKTQITKEIILQAGLEMLIESGYSAINIKTLSQRIGCSTQPLVWHFQNMDGLRKALADYALTYANQKMCPTMPDAMDAFRQVGHAYIKIALEEPNLFHFVFLNGSASYPMGNSQMLIDDEENIQLIQMIAGKFQISVQKAGEYLQNTLIFTHGLATFVATGMMHLSEDEMLKLINQAGNTFLAAAGVSTNEL